MLLTITTTHTPATDLGYLLHKNPARVQTFSMPWGNAHVFYPEVSDVRCTAALLLDIDPIGLVRNRRGPAGEGNSLEQYVNDRPYVASSFLSVAIAQVFGSALNGRSNEREKIVNEPIPLIAKIAVLPCRGGEALLRGLFEPLDYTIEVRNHPLDAKFPEWGPSRYFTVTLTGRLPLHQLLTHLYVLIPVLDDDKHYWVEQAEVEKLLRHGAGWLNSHPLKDVIVDRYLKHQKSLATQALSRLLEEDQSDAGDGENIAAGEEAIIEEKISLHQQRLGSVMAILKAAGAKRILDLGCGEGKLLRLLLNEREFDRIVGMDVSHRSLEIAMDKLHLDRLPPAQKERIVLIHGSLNYRDKRLEGFDAAAVVEVIEHLDPPRLAAFERVLFEFARPALIVLTTPNAEYNVNFETLSPGKFRHKDHRFEWTRPQFAEWAGQIHRRFGYRPEFSAVGPVDPTTGAPTQMVIFRC